MCQSIFFNKFAGLRHATLLEKDTQAQVFSCEFCEIFKNTYLTEHLRTTASDDHSTDHSPVTKAVAQNQRSSNGTTLTLYRPCKVENRATSWEKITN